MNNYFKETNATVMAILGGNAPFSTGANLTADFAHYLTIQMDQMLEWYGAIPNDMFDYICKHLANQNSIAIMEGKSKERIIRGGRISEIIQLQLLKEKRWSNQQ